MNCRELCISAPEREILLLRAQAGDEEALGALFESCRGTLYRRALRILAKPQDAEDAVQEAMLAAFKHLDRFQRRADFLTWATRIVINGALQHIRKARTKPTIPWDQVEGDIKGKSLDESLRDLQPTPEQRLQELEQQETLKYALQKLPVHLRRAIELCRFTDHSLEEAANALGVPVTTVKMWLHRGKRALTNCLKKQKQTRGRGGNRLSAQPCPSPKESLCVA